MLTSSPGSLFLALPDSQPLTNISLALFGKADLIISFPWNIFQDYDDYSWGGITGSEEIIFFWGGGGIAAETSQCLSCQEVSQLMMPACHNPGRISGGLAYGIITLCNSYCYIDDVICIVLFLCNSIHFWGSFYTPGSSAEKCIPERKYFTGVTDIS